MTFTSLTFAVFAVLVISLYWCLSSRRAQNGWLLAASYLFYGWWDWRFCFLILASSLFDYFISLRIDPAAGTRRKAWLTASVIANLGLLAVFKYFQFFADGFRDVAAIAGWHVGETTLAIVLPVGISFYTFQTLGYTIDVYRRQVHPCRELVDYLAFVSFFPQLVAGPIERAGAMLPQFARRRQFDGEQAAEGCRLILWGVAKKLVIADRLAILVNEAYATPESFTGPQLMLATFCFAFQIYCDFSAYSDIATGVARLLGIRLMRNFAYPYFSQSISEFWRRWHISLSTWFRDYVYIPLGGGRRGPVRRSVNLLVTFLVSGLWHGAAWRFVVWGGINGTAVAGPRLNRAQDAGAVPGGESFIPRPATLLRIWSTLAVICAAWVFFRATTFADAIQIHRSIVSDLFSPPAYRQLLHGLQGNSFARETLAWLGAFVLWEWSARRLECPLQLPRFPRPGRWAIYSLLFWSTLYLMPRSGSREFIYFDF